MAQGLAALGALEPPLRIRLKASSSPPVWLEEQESQEQEEGLKRIGFETAGDFQIPEFETSLRAYIHPENGMAAYLFRHPALEESFLDLVYVFVDDTSVTVSNAQDSKVDQCPEHPNINLVGASPRQLFEKLESLKEGRPVRAVEAETAAQTYEKGYAQGMDWRVEKGGVSEAEILAQAEEPLTPEQLETVRNQFRHQHLGQVEELLRLRFLEQADLSAAEWETVNNRLTSVHEFLEPDDLASLAEELLESEEELAPPSRGDRLGFQELLEREGKALQGYGQVSGTLEAEIYLLPDDPGY